MCKMLRRGCLIFGGILFLLFLFQCNQIEKAKLLETEGRNFEKAIVEEVLQDNVTENGNTVGPQQVLLQILTGDHKGEKIEGISSASYLFGAHCKKGMKVVTMYLIDGISLKSMSAMAGTIFGVVAAGMFAWIFGKLTQISGYNVEDVENLIYVEEKTNIQVGELLFAGILIAALGAVMDVGMSIASTIYELKLKNPALTRKELFQSGMNVGKDMMGTMSNTLILAFTGGSLNTLVYIYAYDYQYRQVVNMYSVGIELMQGISASLGVILTVPITSAIAAYLLGTRCSIQRE